MRVFVWKLVASIVVGVATFAVLNACGTEDVEKLTGEDTGAVPGNFVVRIAPKFREQIDNISAKLGNALPGGSFLGRFQDDEDSLGLTGSDAKLSDIFGIKIPGIGSTSINQEVFGKIQKLTGDGGNFFERVDTDKFIANTYDPSSANDTDFSKQYYLDMINWKDAIKSLTDAQLAAAAPIVVAVLDTGVLGTHEDLSDVMWRDPNDGEIKGYNAIDDSETTSPGDGNGHGTHVAGIIGGTGNNNKGIHGVGFVKTDADTNGFTEIMSVQVLNDNGAGTSEFMNKGVRWAVKKHNDQKTKLGREKQKLIINMSLGGPFETDGYEFSRDENGVPILNDDVFDFAANNGALIIVAAGNESCNIGNRCKIYGKNFEETYYYPCSYQNVLCVAASTHEDKLAGFSNRNNSVGITAPGWQIRSTVPTDVNSAQYAFFNGTSQATPVTAGAAAVVWSMYPNFSADEIKAILTQSAAKVNNITSEISSGNGRLDLKKALEYAADLTATGKSPAPENVTPADTANSVSAPTDEGDPDASSSKIDGRNSSEQKCGVISGSYTSFFLLLLFGVPLFLTRARSRNRS